MKFFMAFTSNTVTPLVRFANRGILFFLLSCQPEATDTPTPKQPVLQQFTWDTYQHKQRIFRLKGAHAKQIREGTFEISQPEAYLYIQTGPFRQIVFRSTKATYTPTLTKLNNPTTFQSQNLQGHMQECQWHHQDKQISAKTVAWLMPAMNLRGENMQWSFPHRHITMEKTHITFRY